MHDASKVLLGTTLSSAKSISMISAPPADFPAGLAVRRSSTAGLGVTVATGQMIGVSLGKSLSDHAKTAVCRSGSMVPIRLTDDGDAYAYVVKGAPVYIDDVTGMADVTVGSTISNAIYVSGPLDGISEVDGSTIKVALIDMPGGL